MSKLKLTLAVLPDTKPALLEIAERMGYKGYRQPSVSELLDKIAAIYHQCPDELIAALGVLDLYAADGDPEAMESLGDTIRYIASRRDLDAIDQD